MLEICVWQQWLATANPMVRVAYVLSDRDKVHRKRMGQL